jgi:hypothetical protein
VCSAITLCGVNNYCPGGDSIADPTKPGELFSCVHFFFNDALLLGFCRVEAKGLWVERLKPSSRTQLQYETPPPSNLKQNVHPKGSKNCPANTASVAGSDAKADCTLNAGYYCVYDANDACTVTRCPAGSYCPGGASIEDPASPGDNACPAGTTSPVGSSSQNNCVVPPGSYWNGNAVVPCLGEF